MGELKRELDQALRALKAVTLHKDTVVRRMVRQQSLIEVLEKRLREKS